MIAIEFVDSHVACTEGKGRFHSITAPLRLAEQATGDRGNKEGWKTTRLGDVIKLQYGKPLDPIDRKSNGLYPAYGANGEKDRTDKFYKDSPSIIVGRKGSAGEITLTEEKYWPLDVTYFVEFDPEQYVLKFLYYLMLTLDLPSLAKGVKPGINRNEVYALTVSSPAIPEQQRIVALLDEAFDGIGTSKANAEKNLRNVRAIFESHLADIFSRRGDGRTDRQLGSVCERITVGHVGSMASKYRQNGIPFLRSQNIRPFGICLDNVVFIDEQFHASLGKSSLKAGDVAIVRTGYPGTAAVIPEDLGVANCSDLVIVRPGPEIDAHFLVAFFNSSFGKSLVLGKIVGAAQKHFNVTAAKETVLHVPPIIKQQAIVRAVTDLQMETERLETIYQRKIAVLDELKRSLLHRAFNGDL